MNNSELRLPVKLSIHVMPYFDVQDLEFRILETYRAALKEEAQDYW